jgi:hypothetical protein
MVISPAKIVVLNSSTNRNGDFINKLWILRLIWNLAGYDSGLWMFMVDIPSGNLT